MLRNQADQSLQRALNGFFTGQGERIPVTNKERIENDLFSFEALQTGLRCN